MRGGKAAFLAALVFIAILALLQTPPRYLTLPAGASPLNPGWDGSSELVKLMEEKGIDVFIVHNWSDVPASVLNGRNVFFVFISPETPFTAKENGEIGYIIAEAVRMGARNISFLIADEGTELKHTMMANLFCAVVDGADLDPLNPYPFVFIRVPGGGTYGIVLDHASYLDVLGEGPKTEQVWDYVCQPTGYYGGKVVSLYNTFVMNLSGYPVRFKAMIFSDGSIFINQVLRLDNIPEYKELASDVIDYLAGRGWVALIDTAHYKPLSPEEAVQRAGLQPGTIFGDAAQVALTLHPSMWLPVLLSYYYSIEAEFISSMTGSFIIYALSVILLAAVFGWVLGKASSIGKSAPDRPAPVPEERLIAVDTYLRRAVKERLRLGREDVVALYTVMRDVVKSIFGVDISDPRAPDVIAAATGVSRDAVSRVISDIVRHYRKAVGISFRPLVLSWNRRARKLIMKAETLLNAMGTGLAREEGVEYLIRK